MSIKEKILIIDNSLAITGAFKSAIYTANALGGPENVLFVVPRGSSVTNFLTENGFEFCDLRMLEIRKSFFSILLYFPVLFINTFKLLNLVKSYNIKTIIANDYHNLLGFMISFLGFSGNLYTFVRRLPSSQLKILNYIWLKAAFSQSSKVFGVSKSVMRLLPKNKKSILIYNAIDLPEKYSSELFNGVDTIRLVCYANYMPGKGQRDVLNAFSIAKRRIESPIQLHFYGGDFGLTKNREFKDRLVQIADELGISESVFFFGFENDVEKIIKSSHLVLCCSHAESFSRVCVEAAWFGRPVIATRCGGPEEIVIDGLTGKLVNVGDVVGISDAIIELSSSFDTLENMGKHAKIKAVERFSYDRFRKEILKNIS